MAETRRVPLIVPAMLIAASSVSILSTDLYVPSLPHLPDWFGTDAETVQLTLSLNLLAFALAQLVHGPLADRFGRRPVMLAGMAVFALASLACAGAQTIAQLIAARVLQAVAACVEAVVGLAVIRDLYDEAGSVRVLGAFNMAVAIAPAVGPVIGGHVHVWLGWQANFLLLAALTAVVTVLVWRFLPESAPMPRPPLRPGRIVRNYGRLLASRRFVGYALTLSLPLGALFAFITAGPFLFIDRHGVATERYGVYYAAIVFAFFVGGLAANRSVGRAGLEPILRAGLALAVAGAVCLPLLAGGGVAGPATITGAMCVLALGMGLLYSTAPARALEAAHGGAGAAAALLGSLQVAMGGLGALAVGALHDGSAWPMAATVCAFTVLAVPAYVLAAARRGAAA